MSGERRISYSYAGRGRIVAERSRLSEHEPLLLIVQLAVAPVLQLPLTSAPQATLSALSCARTVTLADHVFLVLFLTPSESPMWSA
jgi:hypothetical protein